MCALLASDLDDVGVRLAPVFVVPAAGRWKACPTCTPTSHRARGNAAARAAAIGSYGRLGPVGGGG
jgi:hypothetical protein